LEHHDQPQNNNGIQLFIVFGFQNNSKSFCYWVHFSL